MKKFSLRGGLICVASALVGAGSPTPSSSPKVSATPAAIAAAEITPQGQSALAAAGSIEAPDTPDAAVETARAVVREQTTQIDALVEQNSKLTATGASGASIDVTRDLLAAWKRGQATIDDQIEALGHRGAELDKETAQMDVLLPPWIATKAAVAKDPGVPAETRELVDQVIAAARAASKRVAARRSVILTLQTSVNDVSVRAGAGLAKAESANSEAVKTLLVADSEPLWYPSGAPRPDFLLRWRESSGEQWKQCREYARTHSNLFAIHGAIFAVLLIVMLWLRRRVKLLSENEPEITRTSPIFGVPIATALALSFVFKGDIYAGMPPDFRALLGVFVLIPTVIILRRVLDRRLGLILYSLVVFYALDHVRVATATFPATNRWLFCAEMVGAILAFVLLTRAQKAIHPAAKASLGRGIYALNALAIMVLTVALAANALGYVRLANVIGDAALSSGYLAIFLFTLLRVLEGLIAIALRVRPFSRSRVAQQHRATVQDTVYRVFRLAAILGWFWWTLDRFQIRNALQSWSFAALDYPLPLGAVSLTLGRLLAFAVAIWASIVISRLIRFFLDEEVYERVQLSPGLPYAISTMANYVILVIGFLVALGMLGVDLTKITIVAGAFSVGLGFGLQNIINNFVSGIILLFERPVKVGDIIQIGDAVGEVRRIGIRASIVRTRDGSDVILPNGNLISNQVVNWTYADRRRTVEISLNIAAVTEPNHVLEILRAAVAAQFASPDGPTPEVYVTALTATGFTVAVRAWTDRYEDWIRVRSELSTVLAAVLATENIKLA